MSGIDIRHNHSLPLDQARNAVDEVARKLSERFEIDCEWVDDVLHFNRAGVEGTIELAPKQVHIAAKLGFLMSAFRGPIEQEIRRVLSEKFGS
jgi:putative polyhydroxyalkanoate system protein